MNIYLAGPMRGIPFFNFPMFMAVTEKLRAQGHTVFNPAERDVAAHGKDVCNSPTGDLNDPAVKSAGFSLRAALEADTKYICASADAIYLLPGWEKSKGAIAERALGVALGHQIVEVEESLITNAN